MKTVRDIRRDHLARLVGAYKSIRQFALSVGLAPAHVSQLLGGARDMGEDVARRIETALGLTPSALDVELGEPVRTVHDPLLQQWLPADELKLLADYRQVSSRRQEMLRETAAAYVKLERDP